MLNLEQYFSLTAIHQMEANVMPQDSSFPCWVLLSPAMSSEGLLRSSGFVLTSQPNETEAGCDLAQTFTRPPSALSLVIVREQWGHHCGKSSCLSWKCTDLNFLFEFGLSFQMLILYSVYLSCYLFDLLNVTSWLFFPQSCHLKNKSNAAVVV